MTYDETLDLMLARERPQEDPDFKEVEETLEDHQGWKKYKAARVAVNSTCQTIRVGATKNE